MFLRNKTFIVLIIYSLFGFGCHNYNGQNVMSPAEVQQLHIEIDSLKIALNQSKTSGPDIITFLTFQKEDAELAMNYYVEIFDNSEVVSLKRWEAGGPGKEGTIMQATFDLNGKRFMCSDSPPIHDWDFSPAVSNFVECQSKSELERLFSKLSENGEVAMPLGDYGFSQQFGWVFDQFGVSWQLNLL